MLDTSGNMFLDREILWIRQYFQGRNYLHARYARAYLKKLKVKK